MDLKKIKARAKEGGHYAKWLYVPELIAEVERLSEALEQAKADAHASNTMLFEVTKTLLGNNRS
jgi:hypothetical protein